jgi:hypothetical protein
VRLPATQSELTAIQSELTAIQSELTATESELLATQSELPRRNPSSRDAIRACRDEIQSDWRRNS